MLRTVLALTATLVLVSGCSTYGSGKAEPTPPQPELSCGADKVGNYINVVINDEVLQKIKNASGAKHYRVVGPRDPMTMDYRKDRLTITTDENGHIKTIRCV